MSGLLDTNIVVRYLIDEPSTNTEKAADIIENEDGLQISSVAIAEIFFVLTSPRYRIAREVAIDGLIRVLSRRNIDTFCIDKSVVLRALLLARPSGRVSVPDALIWAEAHHTDNQVIYTHDARFPTQDIEIWAEPPTPRPGSPGAAGP